MLIIPTIALQNGNCIFQLQPSDETVRMGFLDPLKMAKLWRVQNAKTLLIYDRDAARSDKNNYATIARICETLDIPLIVAGGVRSAESVEALLRMGAHKVLVETTRLENVHEIITQFPKTRLGFHLSVKQDLSVSDAIEENAVAFLQYLEEQRCRRAFCTVRQNDDKAFFAPEVYRQLIGYLPKMHLSISGGVRSYQDLKCLTTLHPRIDSVVMYRALYQNVFPCQNIWSWHQKELLNLDVFTTAKIR